MADEHQQTGKGHHAVGDVLGEIQNNGGLGLPVEVDGAVHLHLSDPDDAIGNKGPEKLSHLTKTTEPTGGQGGI